MVGSIYQWNSPLTLILSTSYHKLSALRGRLPEPGQPLAQLVLVAVGYRRADRVACGARQFHVQLQPGLVGRLLHQAINPFLWHIRRRRVP